MNLHDLFTLKILPRINIGVQHIKYTSEYILNLQIHQNGVVDRKNRYIMEVVKVMIHDQDLPMDLW